MTQGDVTTALPALVDAQARGYQPKNTYKGRPGVYYALTKQIVIATQTGRAVLAYCRERQHRLPPTCCCTRRVTRSAAPRFANLADRDDFEAAYAAPVTGSLAGEYFRQPDHPSQGRDETFAESHAMYLTEPATLKAESPAIFACWQARLAH